MRYSEDAQGWWIRVSPLSIGFAEPLPNVFSNINVFALYFIIAISCFVTILDMVLLRFLIFMSRFRAALSPRIERWIQDGVYQLQRQAYEGHDQGRWDRLDQEVPITREAARLSDLPVTSRRATFAESVVTLETKGGLHSKQQTWTENVSLPDTISRPVSPISPVASQK